MMKRQLRRLYRVALGCTVVLAAIADWLMRHRPGAPRPLPVRRILVLRFGLLGDGTALLSPALQRLKELFPASEVHVLATPLQRPLLEALPFVDVVIPWTAGDLSEPRQALRPGGWRAAAGAIAALRRQRYDLALACYGPLTSAVALCSGVPRRVGFAAEAFPLALTTRLPGGRYSRGWHEADYNVALADAAGHRWGEEAQQSSLEGAAADATPHGPPMRLVVEDSARRSVDALLAGCAAPGASPSGPWVVLLPGATNGQAKRWPISHWTELTKCLVASGTGVVLAGGPEDRPLAQAIQRRARTQPSDGTPRRTGASGSKPPDAAAGGAEAGSTGPRLKISSDAGAGHLRPGRGGADGVSAAGVIDLVGRTTLPQLLALLDQASVVVSGDSGPLHLAIALGRPAVAIYGPTDVRQSGPYRATNVTVLRHELPCSPCYSLDRVADCPLGHTLCQRLVTPPRVYNAVQDRLMAQS
ncbi:MAG: glycosyltransferase family 9 protein [Chloroflexota bacterium]|nr:glycosyltransferase family 9 protein [Chloroflexota bacterium]